jgi:hypothetical protein
VVGVAEGLLNDYIMLASYVLQTTSGILTAPRIIPLQTLNVDEYPQKLGNREGRMGVVELDSDGVGELLPSLLALLESTDDIVQRGSAPEVLLLQTELLTTLEVVVRVEHSGNSLSTLLVRY